ncbi:MAG: putative heme d1 biosynthesis radical SAM protein NirJ2 [Firmicutes bacterium]|nr:putative heme d1 biosynthesis radical SAM protein NirJ2 [Bacillota bacterium]
MLVSWMATNECNLYCKHCYQDAGEKKENELSTSQAKSMIDGIHKAGFKIMIFSGGEPLMREDIFELVSYASDKGLRPVFGTNAMLITKEVAVQLKQCGTMAMGISLDSLDPGLHNQFRNHQNAHRLTMAGIKNCREAGLPFQIHTTVLDWNQNEILNITDYAVEAGAIAHYIFFLIPVGRAVNINETSLEIMENERMITKIIAKQKEVEIDIKPTCAPQFTRIAKQMGVNTRFTHGCLAGITYCIISPVGIVRPCAYMTEEAGDIRKTPFAEIWKDSKLFQNLRTQAYKGACANCDYKEMCGGCRARAGYYNNGDYMAEDRYCAYGQKLVT